MLPDIALGHRKRPIFFVELNGGSQRPSETKLVTVRVNEVEKALTPFGIAGRGGWLAPGCDRTVVKFINVGNVKDDAPPPGPAPLGRLGDEVKIARPRSKAGERRLFAAMQK